MTRPTIRDNRIQNKSAVKDWSASDAKRTAREILLLGTTAALSSEKEKRLAYLLDGNVDWEYLLELAEYHGVAPLLANSLSPNKLANKVPAIYSDMLSRIYHSNVYRNMFLSDELVKILARFNRNEIDAITLKGTVLGEQLYVNPGLRTTSDIDILVKPETVSQAGNIIREMGYEESTIQEELDHPFHHVYYKKEKFPFMVELHWGLDDPKMEAGNREEIWQRARQYRFQGGTTMVLSPEDTLLYLAANLLTQDGQQLKYLSDITELLKKNPDNFDWNYVIGTGHSLGISATTYYALKWARELLGLPVPEPVFTALEPSLPRRCIISCLVNQSTLLSPVSWTKLRNETSALARSLMMGRTRQTLAVLSKYRGYKKKAAWLRTAAWIPLVFGASLWLYVYNIQKYGNNNITSLPEGGKTKTVVTTQPRWSIRPYQLGDEEQIFQLWDAVHPERNYVRETWTPWWHWMYNRVPLGNKIWVAEDNGKIVGQYCCILLKFKYDNRTIKGTHSLNTLTHPDYRRQGIMLTLSRKVFDELSKEGVSIVYGFPNKAAYPNDIRLGFSRVADMHKLKRVLHWENSIKTKVNNKLLLKLSGTVGFALTGLFYQASKPPAVKDLVITQISSFDEGINEFWARISRQFPIMVVKNKDYLNWRYTMVPDISYTIFLAEKKKAIDGYLVLRYVERENANAAVIYDWLADSPATAECLLARAVEKCREDSIDYIYWTGTHRKMYLKALRRQGFFHQPFDQEKICVAIPNDKSISREFLSNPKNWAVQLGDSDEL